MDNHRFDDWTRSLVALASRRAAAKALAGGALATLLARLGLEEAAAKCVRPGKKCERGDKCCAGATCKGGKCKCKTGLKKCGKQCRKCCTDADCPGGECGNGVCHFPPICKEWGVPCTTGPECCSGACGGDPDECLCGSAGQPCRTFVDCCSDKCQLYKCVG